MYDYTSVYLLLSIVRNVSLTYYDCCFTNPRTVSFLCACLDLLRRRKISSSSNEAVQISLLQSTSHESTLEDH